MNAVKHYLDDIIVRNSSARPIPCHTVNFTNKFAPVFANLEVVVLKNFHSDRMRTDSKCSSKVGTNSLHVNDTNFSRGDNFIEGSEIIPNTFWRCG